MCSFRIAGIIIILMVFSTLRLTAQLPVTWTSQELIDPAELSSTIKSNKPLPVILSIGPGAIIPHSVDIGMVREAESMKKFKNELANLPRDTQVVVYCGCCPFDRCPNIRPAIQVLKELKFINFKLLDLPHNIKIDWIDKGYPTQN